MKGINTIMICGLAFLSSCYYDNEAYLYGEEQCAPGESTYSGTVAPIITRNCVSCHNQSLAEGGIALENHNALKQHAQNGKLLGVMTHSGGYSPMPKNAPQLSDCNINAIRAWIDGGALDN